MFTCTVPGAALSAAGSRTSRTAASSLRIENTTSAAHASRALSAATAPAAMSGSSGCGERFQTRNRCPAPSSRAAMALPMFPSPMNPMSMTASVR